MKTKTISWIKNSKQYENIKKILFRMELGKELEEEEKIKLIKIYNLLKNQKQYEELIKKIRVYLYLYYDIDILFFEYILAEGLFPILNNYFLEQVNETLGSNKVRSSFYRTIIEQYKNDEKILTFEQNEFITNVLENSGTVYSAPTSFGKSSAIIEKIKKNSDKKTLIIVPSKMLIFQFANQIIESTNVIPITHPEQERKTSNIYVLTQERAQTLININEKFKFDLVFVDEAHHMLESEERSVKIVTLILNLINRNRNVQINYFTPFRVDFKYESSEKYKVICEPLNRIKKTLFEEKIKVKRYFIYSEEKYFLYNETLDELKEVAYSLPEGNKIVYLNKGIDIINYIEEHNQCKSEKIKSEDLRKLLGNGMELFRGVENGFYPIFGIVPYNIRNFMLEEFLKSNSGSLVVNSAALEGINTNAKYIEILDPKKGSSDLKSYELENLIGRVNRLSDVLNDKERLITDVVFPITNYLSKNKSNVEKMRKYLKKVLKKEELKNKSKLQEENILPEEEISIDNQIEEDFEGKKELITPVGKLLAYNNLCNINLEKEEEKIQERIDKIDKITKIDSFKIVNMIVEIFLKNIEYDIKEKNNIKRFENEKTIRYYSIVFNYFINNNSIKEIIDRTVSYWKKKISTKELDLVYVGTFGYLTRNGFKKHWIDISDMSKENLYKYATIKTFIEINFVELTILPFLKILYELDKIEVNIYNKIIYSTDVKEEVELKKMGVSNELFKELKEKVDIKKIFDQSYRKNMLEVKNSIENRIIKKEFEMLFNI